MSCLLWLIRCEKKATNNVTLLRFVCDYLCYAQGFWDRLRTRQQERVTTMTELHGRRFDLIADLSQSAFAVRNPVATKYGM